MTIVVISRRLLLILFVVLLVVWPVAAQVGIDAGAAVLSVLNPQERRLPIYSVATENKQLAISFDAAWGAKRTPLLLDLLDRHGVKTTFFLVTFWIEDYPEMAAEIAARGHELGLHSTTHPHMNSLTTEAVRSELLDNYRTIEEVTGFKPELFRPPFGEYSNRVIEVAEQEGFTVIQWSLDSLDWKDLSTEAIVKRILDRAQPGDIILFHNNGRNTPAAVDVILEHLLADGYEVVPISELLHKGDYYIDHEGRQHPQ